MMNGGEGSSTSLASSTSATTLDDVMRAPAVITPDVVVLDTTHEEKERKRSLNPKEDLWLTSADGRYNSPIIPLHVGTAPHSETFHVHRNILLKAEYFRRALCGDFREAEAQAITLPEEDPAIFHFIVAFLYEDKYVPILPVATVLADDDKGKKSILQYHQGGEDGNESTAGGGGGAGAGSDSDSSAIIVAGGGGGGLSDSSNAELTSRRRRERRRRRQQDRHWERLREKHPGAHRPGCACHQCLVPSGPPCWNCGAPRPPPPPPPPIPIPIPIPGPMGMGMNMGGMGVGVGGRPIPPLRNPHPQQRPPPPPVPQAPTAGPAPGGAGAGAATGTGASAAAAATGADNNNNRRSNHSNNGDRISGQDLRTWLLAYEQSIDVYICANKFLLDGFKLAIARVCIDMLETAGADAAQMEVLELCDRLYGGLPESDRLLRMVFARVGFLQPQLFRRAPQAALAFLHAHPEVSALLLREVGARREEDFYPGNGGIGGIGGPGSAGGPHHPHHHNPNYPNYANHNNPNNQLFPPMERPVSVWGAVPGGRPAPPHYEPGRMPRAHRW